MRKMAIEAAGCRPAEQSRRRAIAAYKGQSLRGGGVKGFALVETLLAAFLLAFLILSLYGAFSFGFKVIKISQEGVRADQILTDRLEALRLCSWSNITSSYLPDHFSVTNQGTLFNGTILVSQPALSESYSNTLRQVSLTLSWDSGGSTRSRSMSTLVSQYGIATYKP
jgi:Tfp pilus assembly protein PilW